MFNNMYFLLGFIAGLLIALLFIIVLIYLKNPIQKTINVIEKNISSNAPRGKGMIVEPLGTLEEIRDEILAKNKKEGKDTPIKDLM